MGDDRATMKVDEDTRQRLKKWYTQEELKSYDEAINVLLDNWEEQNE